MSWRSQIDSETAELFQRSPERDLAERYAEPKLFRGFDKLKLLDRTLEALSDCTLGVKLSAYE